MSDQQTNAPLPGWYPDADGAVRWWDGGAWTEHVGQLPAGPAPLLERPRIADDAPVDSWWTWALALFPVLAGVGVSLVTTPLWHLTDPAAYAAISPIEVLMLLPLQLGLSFLVWGVSLFFCYRDHQRLLALGVERPFHWAFGLFGAIVYLIGRHVVLRTVSRTPGAPMWVAAVLNAVLLVVTLVWSVWITIESVGY